MGDTAIIAAAATVAAVETLTATDSNETADSENALPTDDMPTAATSTETTTELPLPQQLLLPLQQRRTTMMQARIQIVV
jgi:hypothetical protein